MAEKLNKLSECHGIKVWIIFTVVAWEEQFQSGKTQLVSIIY